jgi:hypothetical protein
MNRVALSNDSILCLIFAAGAWCHAQAADGPFVFRDVAKEAGLHDPLRGMMGHAAAWGDVDGDGRIDLFVGTFADRPAEFYREGGGAGPVPNQLLLNRDDRFVRSQPEVFAHLGRASGSVFADFDNDGRLDLYVGGPNRMFVNLGGGKFREATEIGLKTTFSSESDSPSCGVAFGDFDRDGLPDMLIGSHHKAPWNKKPNAIRLFRNLGSTPQKVRFEEVTAKVGIVNYPMKVPHVEIRDFDNDGWPDLYTAVATMRDGKVYPAIYKNLSAARGELPQFQETAFVHRKDFPLEEDTPRARSGDFYEKLVANGKVMYYAPGPSGDFDNDGRLDIFLANWWPKLPSLLLKNETPAGGYLDVTVVGAKGVNRMGIGAMVRAYNYKTGRGGESDAMIASEEIATGYGFCSGQPAVAHLGLGEAATCDLVITLPHGKGRIVRREVKANRRLEVSE